MHVVRVVCRSHQYGCANGRCIYKEWMCDGVEDCPLGDDELPSLCSKLTAPRRDPRRIINFIDLALL